MTVAVMLVILVSALWIVAVMIVRSLQKLVAQFPELLQTMRLLVKYFVDRDFAERRRVHVAKFIDRPNLPLSSFHFSRSNCICFIQEDSVGKNNLLHGFINAIIDFSVELLSNSLCVN